jgi:spore germination protein
VKNKGLKIITILLLIGGSFFIFQNRNTLFSRQKQSEIKLSSQQNKLPENVADNSSQKSFFISGWLPYWRKNEGAASLTGNMNLFTEINPFAFAVDPGGNILDKAEINNPPWPELRKAAGNENVRIIPTILWGDAEAMHKIFSNPDLLNRHVENIAELLQKNNFEGVDIDYEGKDIADRDNFSTFLKLLQQKLSQENKSLNCTVEARTEDSPPAGFSGTRAMSFANDFSTLNNFCDTVRVMAYDQVFQIHRANAWTDTNEQPSAPNSDNQWVEDVMRYALKYIKPDKLILGVPSYGWEFKLEKISGGYRYTRFKSVSYPEAISTAKSNGIVAARDAGGELSFIYNNSGEEHIVTFSDAESMKEKIDIAKNLGLKGISLFKIDGLSDPQLFSALHEANKIN